MAKQTITTTQINPASPAWTDYTPTVTGFSSVPTNTVNRYILIGKICILTIRQLNDGTSNATTMTITLPVAALTKTNAAWSAPVMGIRDNGTTQATPGYAEIVSGGTAVTIYKDSAGTPFTATGGKRINEMTIIYETA